MKYGWKKTLKLYRGLPGSGKSTIALSHASNYEVVENDHFWENDHGVYQYDPEMTHIAGWWCWAEAFRRLRNVDEVSVANVFARKDVLMGYVNEALKHEIKVAITEVVVDPERAFARGVRGIPKEAFDRMVQSYETFTEEEKLKLYETNAGHIMFVAYNAEPKKESTP